MKTHQLERGGEYVCVQQFKRAVHPTQIEIGAKCRGGSEITDFPTTRTHTYLQPLLNNMLRAVCTGRKS